MHSLTPRFLALLSIVAVVEPTGCNKVDTEIYQRDMARLKADLAACGAARTKLRGRYDQAVVDLSAASGERQRCARELAAMKSQGAKLDAGLRRALDRIGELERIASRQRAIFDHLRASLSALEKAGKLRIGIVRGQFVVQMADQILFPTGSSKLKGAGEEALAEITAILAKIPGRRWQVAGHTDSVGGAALNWALSQSRAWSVTRFMLRSGMPPEQVSYAAYGEYSPTADNETKEGKARNRRIELVLIPNMEEILGPLLGKGGI